jgi:uncharacterized protein YjbJ (UPF0337 family)
MTDRNIDQATGRIKEAAGALPGAQRPKNEGYAGQAKGSLKKAADKVAETVRGTRAKQRAWGAMNAPSRSSVGR